MAKSAASRRLKVYAAQFGFHDSVVAAPSQAAALAAWGMRQNLFAEGGARVTADPLAVEAALAQPGVPLRRAVGSNDRFSLEPSLPDVPDWSKAPRAARAGGAAPKTRAAKPPPAPPPPPDRSALAAAEAALARVEVDRVQVEAELAERRRALEDEEAQAHQAWRRARQAAQDALAKAQKAFRAAGGLL